MLSKMKSSTEGCRRCSICFEMNSSEKTTVTEDVMDFLKFLILRINCKLLQESSICETCSTKIQSACKLKTAYLENLLKTEAETERCVKCEICKNILNQNDCVSLFDSLTESNRLDLFRYLSTDLESKIPENPQTCELCHKSLLNFCTITNLITIFDLDNMMNNSVVNKNESQDSVVMNEHSQMNIYACSSGNCDENNEVEIKREAEDTSYDIKEEKNDDIECGEFQYSNEDDVKMDSDEELGMKEIWKHIETNADTDSLTNWPINIYNNSQQTKIVKCPICQFQPKNKSYLKKHMSLHKKHANLLSFQCEICKFQTKSKVCLEKHRLMHRMSKEIEVYTCYNCTYRTKNKEELSKHMLDHQITGDVEIFQCQLCDYSSKRKCELTKHVLSHKNIDEIEKFSNEKFQCHICPFRAKHRYHLNNHMIIHTKDDEMVMFECELCKFQTKRNSSLKKHMLTHKKNDEVEMFKCPDCNYQTKRKDTLRGHMLVHKKTSDIAMYECQLCHCKIKRRGDVKRHMLTHKNENEIEMFACEICNYKTKRKGDIKKHMMVHEKSIKKENGS